MSKDVTIIGAGVVGICSALSLLEKGLSVEMIDRDRPASGASHGNAGVVSPWSCVPQSLPGLWRKVPRWLLDPDGPISLRWGYLPHFLPWALRFIAAGNNKKLPAIADAMNALNRPNVDLYRYHLNGTGQENLIRDSLYVHVYRNASGANLNQLDWRIRLEREVPLKVVNGDELREFEPALSPAYKSAVIIKDQARATDPGAVGKALYNKAMSMGASFRRTVVNALHGCDNGGWEVDTDHGTLSASTVVLAAGAWSARLLRPLGLKVPLEAERGYHLNIRDAGITVNNSIMEGERKFVASSMLSGVRCAGTAEFAGLDAPPNYRRAKTLKKLAKEMFPGINVEHTEEWMGTRPSFPDSLPCIGQVPDNPGLFVAFGHSHYGFGMAPQTGRVIAEIVSRETPNIDLSPYQIERFG